MSGGLEAVYRTALDGGPDAKKQVCLWFNTSGALNRYDGYKFKSYRRDRPHPNYPAGGFFQYIFKDRSGNLWSSSNESLDRFDPATETSTRFPIHRNGPDSVLGSVSDISQDGAGICGWPPRPACIDWIRRAERSHYSHDPADPVSQSSALVRSTYEPRQGTLWVCTMAGLDAFDRRTEKVTERIRLKVSESREMKVLDDHAGVLGITYTSGNWLPSYDRRTRRLTLYSYKDREPAASDISGALGILEDADGNLGLATRGSGLVKIDPSRRNAIRYRHSSQDLDSVSEDMLTSVFKDREGSIWVGTATTGLVAEGSVERAPSNSSERADGNRRGPARRYALRRGKCRFAGVVYCWSNQKDVTRHEQV